MRIVMVCDDIRIDRRILQEAETLIAEGHEVILLATYAEGWPEHEHIGSVKVERLCAPPGGAIESGVLSTIRFVEQEGSRLKNWLVRQVWRGVKCVIAISIACMALIHAAYLYARTMLIVKPLRFALRLAYLIRRGSMRDRYLAKRITYYDPDCIHVHDLPQLRAGVMAGKLVGVPLIYDAHELYPDIGTLSLRQRLVMRRRERRFIKEADVAITVNPFLAQEMQNRYALERLEVILNAVDPPADFDPRQRCDRYRSMLPISKECRILLFQGWMSDDRGLLKIVEALVSVPEHIHCVFMGYGDERVNLQRKAVELQLTARVHILDAVPQDELIFWSASADAGVIPYPRHDRNYRFCSPNKLFEFIQAGLPMLVNDSAYLRSVVEKEGIGLVRKLDTVSDCAEAITELFSSEERLSQYRRRILEIQEAYRWTKQGAHLLDIYRSVVPQHMDRAA